MRFEVLREYPDRETKDKWDRFLSRVSFPSHYSAPAYFREPFWKDKMPFAVLVFDDSNEITAVATGLSLGSGIQCGMFVRPQVAIAPGARDGGSLGLLFDGFRAAGSKDLSEITLFSWDPIPGLKDLGFSERISEGEERTVVLDLSVGADAIFSSFSPSRRNNLRKAMKRSHLEIADLSSEDELRELYPIHAAWCRTKSIAPTPYEDLKCAWQLKENRKILVAKHEGRVIAASYFRFSSGGVVEYAGNNSDPEFLHLKPNDLLMWESIKWACNWGFPKFSMGGSHTFLQRFGGEIVNTYRYQADLSWLKTNRFKNNAKSLFLGLYRAIPNDLRQKAKRGLGIRSGSINPDSNASKD